MEFRLDEDERRHSTERALSAIAAIFVEHRWLTDLADATARVGGTPMSTNFVDADALARDLSA